MQNRLTIFAKIRKQTDLWMATLDLVFKIFLNYNNLDFREKHGVTLYFRYMCAKLILKISRKYENIICVDGNPSAGTQHV